MKKIIFIAYTDVGNWRTPKEKEFLTLIKQFSNKQIQAIFVRHNYGDDKRFSTVIPGGNIIPFIFAGIDKYIWRIPNHRKISTNIFDKFLAKKIKKIDADVAIFAENTCPLSMTAAREKGMKVLSIEMTAHPQFTSKLYNKEYKKWGIPEVSVKKDPFPVDCFISISPYITRTYLLSNVPSKKVITIPYGGWNHISKTPPKRTKKSSKKIIFLFVGSGWVGKGIPYLLNAWKDLAPKNAELWLIGTPLKYFNHIKKKFSYKNVVCLGFQNPSNYYPKADVFVFPTLTDGRSKVIPEAMINGLPVITTTNDGSCSLVKEGKNGFVIPPANESELRKALKRFLDKPRLSERMGQNAKSSIKGFTWERSLKSASKHIKQRISKL